MHCHDCGCANAHEFEGVYCDRMMVDTWHVKTHKCDKEKFDPSHAKNAPFFKRRKLNPEYAEQTWSKTNRFQTIMQTMQRAKWRCFLRHLCIWRNMYVRSGMPQDINPSRSTKTLERVRKVASGRLARAAKRNAIRRRPAAVVKKPSVM